MTGLRTLRVILAAVFLAATVGCLFIPGSIMPADGVVWHLQIVPSALGSTLGATLFWIVATFFCGRFYCSTVCPVGTLSDISLAIRRHVMKKKPRFRFHHPWRWRYDLLILYAIELLAGLTVLGYILDPWNMMCNLAAISDPAAISHTWGRLGIGVGAGILSGVITVGTVIVWSWFSGRKFCNTVCPIGAALSLTDGMQFYHIEIDPDRCTNCMRCEEICPAESIKVVSRYVDNGRCVRCLDCLDACQDKAIRLQPNRNRRPATPLMRRARRSR